MTGGISYDRSMHGSLREEVQLLRKRVVNLETAEADNEKLRKELARLNISYQEEKSQMELEFMNQLTSVARENALKLEEMEGRLTESTNVNRALGEQLRSVETPDEVKSKIENLENNHNKELARVVDANKEELARVVDANKEQIESLQEQLAIVKSSRDETSQKLDETKLDLQMKRKEVDSLEVRVKALSIGPSPKQTDSRNASLQKILDESQKDAAKMKNDLESLENEMSRKSSVMEKDNADLKQKLENRESELTLKITEVSRKSSFMESENSSLRERLASRDSELALKVTHVQRLESKLKDVTTSANLSNPLTDEVKALEKENLSLKSQLRASEANVKQQGATITELERSNQEHKMRSQRLERSERRLSEALHRAKGEIEELRCMDERRDSASSASVASAPVQEDIVHISGRILASPEMNPNEKRTTQIIRRLEKNLKREGQMKQTMTTNLKLRKQRPEADIDTVVTPSLSDNETRTIDYLKSEVDELRDKLDKECELTSSLRREIAEARLVQSKVVAPGGNERDRGVLTAMLSSHSLAAMDTPTMQRQDPSPRTPVRGIVQSFERRISQNHDRRVSDSIIETDDVLVLKDALRFERHQVHELEEELTRQCEVNCSLLKEISSLTSDTESTRSNHIQQFERGSNNSEQEIDRLSTEIYKLKSQLSLVEESKLTLSKMYDQTASADRKEIARLTKELRQVASQLSKAEDSRASISKRFETSSSSERKEIEDLKQEVQQLQMRLDQAEGMVVQLQNESEASHQKLESRESRIDELEQDLIMAREANQAGESRDNEIAELKSVNEMLQKKMSDADMTKAALVKEKEASDRLDRLVQDLKKQLQESGEKCDALSQSLSKSTSVEEKEEIDSLKVQVDSLVAELGRVSEHRDELERNERIHQEKFELLQNEVDSNVEKFEQTRFRDQEAISRLQEQVKSLQEELQNTLGQLQEKEAAEDTVEELARKNQLSMDCQINKLQKELTKTHVAKTGAEVDYRKKIQSLEEMIDSMKVETDETIQEKQEEVEELRRGINDKIRLVAQLTKEKDQLVLSMNDMTSSRRGEIDELQGELMEMSTRAANQAREAQALKQQLEDSSYRKAEVERLRSRVRELSDQLASKDGARVSERTTLEVQNSELRQKLRQVSLDRQAAEDKISEMVAEKGGSSKQVQVLRERNAALKFEVEKLTKKLKKFVERSKITKPQGGPTVEATRFMI